MSIKKNDNDDDDDDDDDDDVDDDDGNWVFMQSAHFIFEFLLHC
jgi:hypothetical protein